MKFVIRCHECRERLKLKDEMLGKKIRCRCGALMRLPKSLEGMESESASGAAPPVTTLPPLEPRSRPAIRSKPPRTSATSSSYQEPSGPAEFLQSNYRQSKQRRQKARVLDESDWRIKPASEVGFFGQAAGYGIGAGIFIMIGAVYWYSSEAMLGAYTCLPPLLFSFGAAGTIIGIILFIANLGNRSR